MVSAVEEHLQERADDDIVDTHLFTGVGRKLYVLNVTNTLHKDMEAIQNV